MVVGAASVRSSVALPVIAAVVSAASVRSSECSDGGFLPVVAGVAC